MKSIMHISLILIAGLMTVSCVSKKQFTAVKSELDAANAALSKCGQSLNDYMSRLASCESERDAARATAQTKDSQISDLRSQLDDCRSVRDRQLEQVGELTVLSKSANENIRETLSQLEKKDKYIHLLQAAKSKADSINLALAVNLKSVLSDGLADKDVEVMVDKTVVMINLSDKMLFQSGSANLTSRANEVLGKIAKIVEARPDVEVLVEGYTDNVPISNACMMDNWDLSVKRSTSVVRALQKNFKIDPNRLIAAGRGEYNALADNSTADGRATNRRTRIIIMPKLDQFYDLLSPPAEIR